MSNFWQDKRVLIAGGAGLIGQSLIRALLPLGAKITATEFNSRIDPEIRGPIHVRTCDLRSSPISALYENKDVVFWAAAKVGGAKMIKERPMALLEYNLALASRNLAEAVEAGVERFCYVSSSYVYPESDRPAVERDTDSSDVPLVHYGLGHIKRFMEKLCKAYQLTSKTRFTLVRPTAIYGPHDSFDLERCHVVPALIRKVAEKQNPLEIWGDGSELRQFTYVDDLVEGMLLATEHYCVAEPINIASNEISTVNDVWQSLLELNGEHRQYIPFEREFTWPRAIQYLGDKPTVVSRRLVNTDQCRMLLGYKCTTSLTKGLARTLDWYKANRETAKR